MKLLDDECELSELKLLPLEQGLLDEIDELLIWERQLEEEQAELLGNPLLLQLEEQQEVKLSDQQLHEELDEKENWDELLLDDDDRLLELLQVEELQLTLEYDPQDPDNEDEELDPLPLLVQLLELQDDFEFSEDDEQEGLDDSELKH